MIAGTHVLIDTELLRDPSLAGFYGLGEKRLHATLLVEHAFGRGDDDLRSLRLRGERVAQHVAHPLHVVGAVDVSRPAHAEALQRRDDGVVGRAARIERAGGGDILAAGRRRVVVVDDEDHAVLLVENGIADRRGQAVVPEAAVTHHRDRALAGLDVEGRGGRRSEPVAHGRRADVERRQDRKEMAADIGRDVMRTELLFHELHRREDRPLRTADAKPRRSRRHDFRERLYLVAGEHRLRVRRRRSVAEQFARVRLEEATQSVGEDVGRIFAAAWQDVLAGDARVQVAPMQDGRDRLLDEFGLPLLDHEHRALASAEGRELVVDQRVGDVHDVERHGCLAVDVREAQPLQRAHGAVVHAAEHHETDVAFSGAEGLVESVALDEIDSRWPALFQLLLLVGIGSRWQHDAVDVALCVLQRVARGKGRAHVVLTDEAAVHVAGPNADLQHHRCIRRFRQIETVLDRLHDRRQVRPWIEQPHLRLHREGVASLLHDRGAFAIVFAENDQCAAGHAAGGEVGERVRGDVGARGRLPRHGAPQRIHHRRCEHGGGARLRC